MWESDKPQFRWQATGDYPSGIESWAIFINGNEYAHAKTEFIRSIEEMLNFN